jgi:hypothetical protein
VERTNIKKKKGGNYVNTWKVEEGRYKKRGRMKRGRII